MNYTNNFFVIHNQNKLTLFIIAFFLLFILVTLRKDKSKHFLDITYTNELRGLSIILVLVHHLYMALLGFKTPNDNPFYLLGTVGVAIFLLLSGFGITYSYTRKSYAKGIDFKWLPRKYLRILVPYFIVTVLWYILDATLLGIKASPNEMITTLLGLHFYADPTSSDPNMWFIPFILLQYIIFWIVFSLKNIPNFYKPLVILAISVILVNVIYHFTQVVITGPTIGYSSMFSVFFPIGSMVALYYDDFKESVNHFPTLKILASLAFVSIGIYSVIQSNLSTSLIDSTIFILALFFMFARLGFISLSLEFIGTISFEIYLLHGPIMYRYDFIFSKMPMYLAFPIYFLLIVSLSIVLKWISNQKIKFKFNINKDLFYKKQYLGE